MNSYSSLLYAIKHAIYHPDDKVLWVSPHGSILLQYSVPSEANRKPESMEWIDEKIPNKEEVESILALMNGRK